MFRASFLQGAAAALLGTSLLASGGVEARETIIAFSSAQSKMVLQQQVEQAIGHLLDSLEQGQSARFIDATNIALIADIEMPSGSTPVTPRRALQHNRKAVAQVGRFLERAKPNSEHPGEINLPDLLRFVRSHYPAPKEGADLIVLGHPIYAPENAPSQSMVGARVPSDGYVASGPDTSLYGTAELSGSLEGYDVYFGWTALDWPISPAHRYAVERIWAVSVEAHGASMAYQSPAEDAAGLTTLFDLAGTDAPDRKHSQPLEPESPITMHVFKPDTGEGPENELSGHKPSEQAPPTLKANGVEIDDFSLFASQPHPNLSGVEVTTGIRYEPQEYPNRYVNAWCYFLVERDDSQHRIKLGTKEWGQPVNRANVSSRARFAAGINRDDVDAGRSACKWPKP